MAPAFSYFLQGYPVSYKGNQRLIGPIGNCKEIPPYGSEILVKGIPYHFTERELFPLFTKAGKIFKIRLMMQGDLSTLNKGVAFVTYTCPEEAKNAVDNIQILNKYGIEILTIEIYYDNRRLFVGGIPEHKTKDEIWDELIDCGFDGVTDIIMYRSYTDRANNRGYVFVDFESHKKAAKARVLFANFDLWGSKLTVDWSTPLPYIDSATFIKIKKLFFRNLKVTEPRETFLEILNDVLEGIVVLKVFRFKDYGFVHFMTHKDAEEALKRLKVYYKDTLVEVLWAVPQHMAPKKRHLLTYNNYDKSDWSTPHHQFLETQASPSTSAQSLSYNDFDKLDWSTPHHHFFEKQASPSNSTKSLSNNWSDELTWPSSHQQFFEKQASPSNSTKSLSNNWSDELTWPSLHQQFFEKQASPSNSTKSLSNNWPDELTWSSSHQQFFEKQALPSNSTKSLLNNWSDELTGSSSHQQFFEKQASPSNSTKSLPYNKFDKLDWSTPHRQFFERRASSSNSTKSLSYHGSDKLACSSSPQQLFEREASSPSNSTQSGSSSMSKENFGQFMNNVTPQSSKEFTPLHQLLKKPPSSAISFDTRQSWQLYDSLQPKENSRQSVNFDLSDQPVLVNKSTASILKRKNLSRNLFPIQLDLNGTACEDFGLNNASKFMNFKNSSSVPDPMNLSTVKDEYFPGDNEMMFGCPRRVKRTCSNLSFAGTIIDAAVKREVKR
nr:uncharacterized protein LOC111417045 [Onthophagus taurus]